MGVGLEIDTIGIISICAHFLSYNSDDAHLFSWWYPIREHDARSRGKRRRVSLHRPAKMRGRRPDSTCMRLCARKTMLNLPEDHVTNFYWPSCDFLITLCVSPTTTLNNIAPQTNQSTDHRL